jgi:tRNA(fMet)-specific endonuclease VapC
VLKAATGPDLLKAQHLLQQTEDLLGRMWIVPLDEKAGIQFDLLRLKKGLKKMGRADLLIASITLATKAVLVTRNVRHFKLVPNLRVINWVD